MDIHPPEGPTRSFREFLIHIGIVTIGILIALGLESMEETLHNRHLVREARDNFHQELAGNRANMDKELRNDRKMLALLDSIITGLPALRTHPDQLAARVAEVMPSGYFFSSSRWESALSTGALGHMSVDQINRYAEVNFLVHSYTQLEANASPDWQRLEAFFSAHPHPTPEVLDHGVDLLYLYRADTRGLDQVAKELSSSIDHALELK